MIVAGNRDEFHARPTQDAHWWPDHPDILGGRDQQAGGTWLALRRNGRFASVTNYRDAEPSSGKLRSRGHLITGFLNGTTTPLDYLETIDGERYAGFNLLVSDGTELAYLSNRGGGMRSLAPGVYGLANATLDTPWHKVARSKAALAALLESNSINETALLRILADRQRARVSEVDSERLPFDKAHAMTAPFVVQADYGTRCSSVILGDAAGKLMFVERRFNADGNDSGRSAFRLDVTR